MSIKTLFSTLLLTVSYLLATNIALATAGNMKPQVIESKYDFQQTVLELTNTLKSKGMKIFAQIDHQKAAKEVGLEMQPATVIIYGVPKVGTPLMVKDASLALQLPLKVLVTQVDKNRVDVLFNTAEQVVSHSQTDYADVENSLTKAEQLIKATISK